jgi:hypothetical protein
MARDQALPCTLDGEDAGFDLRLKEVAAADLPTAPGVRAGSGRTDIAMSLKWGGDSRCMTIRQVGVKPLAAKVGYESMGRVRWV